MDISPSRGMSCPVRPSVPRTELVAADRQELATNVSYWTKSGHRSASGWKCSVANDPTETLAAHCGNTMQLKIDCCPIAIASLARAVVAYPNGVRGAKVMGIMAYIACVEDKRHTAFLIGCAFLTAAAVLLAEPPAAQAGCNSGNVANTALLSDVSCEAAAAGLNATAVGISSNASGDFSSAYGAGSTASDLHSTAYGNASKAINTDSSAYGRLSTASGTNSSAYGLNSIASGGAATAVGGGGDGVTTFGARATGDFASAFGASSTASGFASTASGEASTASGNSSSVYGTSSTASGDFSSAYGNASTASGNSSSAYGSGSNASGTSSVAIGGGDGLTTFGAIASGTNSTAIGVNASATFANSAAFGNGATAMRADQQVFGTVSNTYTMPGITLAASRAAQVGPTQIVTSDTGGNLATSTLAGLGLATASDISGINSQISNLSSRIDTLTTEARAGTALALAASGLHYDARPGKASLAAAFGNYKGQSGLAAGLGYAFSDRFRVNAAFTGAPQINDYGMVVGGSWTLN